MAFFESFENDEYTFMRQAMDIERSATVSNTYASDPGCSEFNNNANHANFCSIKLDLAHPSSTLSQQDKEKKSDETSQAELALSKIESALLRWNNLSDNLFEESISFKNLLKSENLVEVSCPWRQLDYSIVKHENLSDVSRFLCSEHVSVDELYLTKELDDTVKDITVKTADDICNISIEESPKLNLNKPIVQSVEETNCRDEGIYSGDKPDLSSLKPLEAWNLPEVVLQAYARKGISEMFDWQIECLSNPKVLFEHANLVYSAPTSAGKTLVSEIVLLKTVLEREKKVIFILPFISVVREKTAYLQDVLNVTSYRVEGFYGGCNPPGGFEAVDVAICTIEKANSIINKLLEQRKLEILGAIIVDEVHLVSDAGRGYILELLVAKVLYICRKLGLQIQIVAMSATMGNIDTLKHWLAAEVYSTDFRPVPLQMMLKVGNKIYDYEMRLIRDVTDKRVDGEGFPSNQNDPDHVIQLCIETLLENCSVLIFCPSKDWCENLAVQLAGTISSLCKSDNAWGIRLRDLLKSDDINDIKRSLQDLPTGFDYVLEKTFTHGCAFHHAGLTMEERDIVETHFKAGVLKVIVATSTLSSGVNLPARRVIIRSPLFGGKVMNPLTYRQMIGRAGRTGKDTLGESILICTERSERMGRDLVTTSLKPISSCLDMDGNTHLKRALLEVISAGVVCTTDEIQDFMDCTLLGVQRKICGNAGDIDKCVDEAVRFLMQYEFVRLQENKEEKKQNYIATRLGLACLASSMPPIDGLILFAELQKARRCFVLETDLHAIYLVTPNSVCFQMPDLDWLLYLDIWEKLAADMKKVGELVGVKESFLIRAMRGLTNLDYKSLQIHKRFYAALALQELVDEVPLSKVAAKYKCTRGLLQALQQMASTFAGIVSSFCDSLQWSTMSLIVAQFGERLLFGAQRELVDLLRLPTMNINRARAFFEANISSLIDMANADVFLVEKILHNMMSFALAKKCDHENVYEAERRQRNRNFFITGRVGLTIAQTAKLLVKEARQYLEYEIGVKKICWAVSPSENVCHNEKRVDYKKCSQESPKECSKLLVTSTTERNVSLKGSLKTSFKQEIKLCNTPPLPQNLKQTGLYTTNQCSEIPGFINTKAKCNMNKLKPKLVARHCSRNDMANLTHTSKVDAKRKDSLDSQLNEKLAASPQYFELQKSPLSIKSGRENNIPITSISSLSENSISKEVQHFLSDSGSFMDMSATFLKKSLYNKPLLMNDSHILSCSREEADASNFLHVDIIDICGNSQLFTSLFEELMIAKRFGLSLAVKQREKKVIPVIGRNFLQHQTLKDSSLSENAREQFFIDQFTYLSSVAFCIDNNVVYYMNMQMDSNCDEISAEIKWQYLTKVLRHQSNTLLMLDGKEQLKILLKAIPDLGEICSGLEDPLVGNWLLQPESSLTLLELAQKFAPECTALVRLCGMGRNIKSLGLDTRSSISPKLRCSIEACVTVHVLKGQRESMQKIGNGRLMRVFTEVEMPLQLMLAHMDNTGFPVNEEALQKLLNKMKDTKRKVEEHIYKLHGSRFNLHSSDTIGRILGLQRKCKGRLKTTRQILEKVDTPIAQLVIIHRKLDITLTKTIQPIVQRVQNNRIYCQSLTHTATGRISMAEPNIQNVAKDFHVYLGNETVTISCRSTFMTDCKAKRCLVSSDFCQLEMRILAHLSQDISLLRAMRSRQDIFKVISAHWNKLPESAISEELRHRTKQICYGIIYGMGIRSMEDALKCTIEEAELILEQFHSAYPGIRLYMEKVVKYARQNGYVETITGRRRYLEQINNREILPRNQAERQAINSTIQGSAADITKSAMLRMKRNIAKYCNKLKISTDTIRLVLHLHDELIFEVPEGSSKKIAKLLSMSMENCVKLSVPLKVKLRIGRSWGELEEISL